MSSDVTDLKKSNTDSESSDDSGFLYDSQDSDRTFSQTSASMNTTVSVWWCRCGIHRIKIINQSHRFAYSGCIRFTINNQPDSASVNHSIASSPVTPASILGTRPLTEGSVESPDTLSATVPCGSALQDVLAAYVTFIVGFHEESFLQRSIARPW